MRQVIDYTLGFAIVVYHTFLLALQRREEPHA